MMACKFINLLWIALPILVQADHSSGQHAEPQSRSESITTSLQAQSTTSITSTAPAASLTDFSLQGFQTQLVNSVPETLTTIPKSAPAPQITKTITMTPQGAAWVEQSGTRKKTIVYEYPTEDLVLVGTATYEFLSGGTITLPVHEAPPGITMIPGPASLPEVQAQPQLGYVAGIALAVSVPVFLLVSLTLFWYLRKTYSEKLQQRYRGSYVDRNALKMSTFASSGSIDGQQPPNHEFSKISAKGFDGQADSKEV